MLDSAATRALEQLRAWGFLDRPGERVDWQQFHNLRKLVRERFDVPQTSITPLMARVLFGLAWLTRPGSIVVAGSYFGNALVWLAGPSCLGQGTARSLGIDPDSHASEGCRRNFASIGAPRVDVLSQDARVVLADLAQPIDLLLLDAEEASSGKRLYRELLELAEGKLRPGALVLAHDVLVPKFQGDLAPYMELVRDRSRYRCTATLAIDKCGLEVTRVFVDGREE
jgi:predicted O-methyltransferase YrrM